MSIRLRLMLLVSVLVLISATVLAYLVSAYLDTRDRLREADTILHEFVQAVNAGSAIARLRLEVLYGQSTGALNAPSLEDAIAECEAGFARWTASSRASVTAGIKGESEDQTHAKEIDVLAEVRHGDVVLIPHGWHGPSMAVPGYDLYYLNVMAGPGERAWRICDDPAHTWVRATWDDQEVDPRLPFGPGPQEETR